MLEDVRGAVGDQMRLRMNAMNVLGNGLDDADHYEEALPVERGRVVFDAALGAGEDSMLVEAEQSCGHVSHARTG